MVWQMRLTGTSGGAVGQEVLILDTSSCGALGGQEQAGGDALELISVLLPKEMELGTAEGKHGQRLASSALIPAL